MNDSFSILHGDALEVLKTLEASSIHCCVTSPPYYNLRNYNAPGQIGLESSPAAYVERLVQVFREVKRILREDGTLWLNLGDSYCTQGGWGAKKKDLLGVPWRVALALRDDGWFLRSEIIWHKTNVLPESVRDRPTKAHETLFLLTRAKRYYYDAHAVREPVKESSIARYLNARNLTQKEVTARADPRICRMRSRSREEKLASVALGRNKRSVWECPVASYRGAHFATYPERLVVPCVLAGCPEGGVVLDPFAGAGTTGVVTVKHRRTFIGVELNPEYAEIARARIKEASNR